MAELIDAGLFARNTYDMVYGCGFTDLGIEEGMLLKFSMPEKLILEHPKKALEYFDYGVYQLRESLMDRLEPTDG